MKDRGLLKLASFFVQAIFVALIVPIDLNFMEMAQERFDFSDFLPVLLIVIINSSTHSYSIHYLITIVFVFMGNYSSHLVVNLHSQDTRPWSLSYFSSRLAFQSFVVDWQPHFEVVEMGRYCFILLLVVAHCRKACFDRLSKIVFIGYLQEAIGHHYTPYSFSCWFCSLQTSVTNHLLYPITV